MKRIAIIGSSGAGKSTLARQLGTLLSLPVIHLDMFFWQPGWILRPEDELCDIQCQLVQQETWILDGNYENILDVRLSTSDLIIFLDFHPFVCLYRLIKRYFLYARRPRPDMNQGCPEGIDIQHLKWVWTYPKHGRIHSLQKLQQYCMGRDVVILRRPEHVKQFLRDVMQAYLIEQYEKMLDQMPTVGCRDRCITSSPNITENA